MDKNVQKVVAMDMLDINHCFGTDDILDILDNNDDSGNEYDTNAIFDAGYNISHIPFMHAPNDGTYTRTNNDVHVVCSTGSDKGDFDVFLHHGDKYIDFQNHWIKIEGKTRFSLNGNTYIIK